MSDSPATDTSPDLDQASAEDHQAALGRTIALTDGVVAIALTLLILEIAVPTVAEVGKDKQDTIRALADALGHSTDSWLAFGISFYVIAQFWMLHRHVFQGFARHRDTLTTLNFVFLFSISVMPFTSDLIGKYAENPLSVIVFAANLILANAATWAMLWFGHRNGLLSARGEGVYFRHVQFRGMANLFFYVVSIPVALWNADAGKYCWLGLIVAPRIGTILDRRRKARQEAAAGAAATADAGPAADTESATDTGPATDAASPETGE